MTKVRTSLWDTRHQAEAALNNDLKEFANLFDEIFAASVLNKTDLLNPFIPPKSNRLVHIHCKASCFQFFGDFELPSTLRIKLYIFDSTIIRGQFHTFVI